MEIEKIKRAIFAGKVEWRKHALQRMFERNIAKQDIIEVITQGEIVKIYADDRPFPSVLLFKRVNGRPLHVVVSFDEEREYLYIITAYEPTSEIFERDYKTRKR